jgi:hypothetical protein
VRRYNFDKTDLNRIAKIGYGYTRGMKVDSSQILLSCLTFQSFDLVPDEGHFKNVSSALN